MRTKKLKDGPELDYLPLNQYNGDDHLADIWFWLNDREYDQCRKECVQMFGIDAVAAHCKYSGQECSPMVRSCIETKLNSRNSKLCESWRMRGNFEAWAFDNGYVNGTDCWVEISDIGGKWGPQTCTFTNQKPYLSSKDAFLRYLRHGEPVVEAFGEPKTLIEWACDPRNKAGRVSTLFNRIFVNKIPAEKALSMVPQNRREKSDAEKTKPPEPKPKPRPSAWDCISQDQWGEECDKISEAMAARSEDEYEEYCSESGLFITYGRRDYDDPVGILKCRPPKKSRDGDGRLLTKEERKEIYRNGIAKLREMGKLPPENTGENNSFSTSLTNIPTPAQ